MRLVFRSVMLLALFLAGCTTQVVPPAKIDDPVTVYYADYGIHSALLLPQPEKQWYIEYVFGDYAFCVLNRVDPVFSLGALFCSGGSVFGRREHFTPPPQRPDPDPKPHKLIAFPADRAKVRALLAKMEARYKASNGPPTHNIWNDVDYVPDAEHYSVFNSCNHLTLRSFNDLGYETHGSPILPNFRFLESK